MYIIRKIKIPAAGRNEDFKFSNSSFSTSTSSTTSTSINLPKWLEFVEYNEKNETIKFSKHLLSEGEVAAYQEGTFNSSILDNLPVGSKTKKGILQVGDGINVSNGVISINSSAIAPQTLSFENNELSISGGNSVDLSDLAVDLSGYYTKTEVTTLLNSKANTGHTHTFASLTSKPTTLSGYGITDNVAYKTDLTDFYYKGEVNTALSHKANKNGSSTENFTVKDLTIHGKVNHWLADVIVVEDAKLQLNRTQNSATVEAGLDISNGTSVVSSLNYTTAGDWKFTSGNIYQGSTKVALQNVSISAGNGLTGGGAISANRTITLGTPSTITNSTTNSVTATSHTHAISINNVLSQGTLNAETGRSSRGNLYTYRMTISNTGHPNGSSYGSVISWGHATFGSVQLYGGWASGSRGRLWTRSLRDTTDNWTDWSGIYTDNYHPSADNATKLGGVNASDWVRRTVAQTITGTPTFKSGTIVFNNTRDWRLVYNNDNLYIRNNTGSYNPLVIYNDNSVRINNKLTVGTGTQIVLNGSNGTITTNGNITSKGEITAYSSSDKRLKSNIKPLKSSLSIIEKLNPVCFNWNDKAVELNNIKKTTSKNYGVIAQEIEEVLPDLVHETNSYKSVDYIQLIGVLIGAVKELNNKINKLEK